MKMMRLKSLMKTFKKLQLLNINNNMMKKKIIQRNLIKKSKKNKRSKKSKMSYNKKTN